MNAPRLTYREYAKVRSAYQALDGSEFSTARVQTLLASRLKERNPELAAKLSGLKEAEVRTLVLHLWRYQECERLECLQRGDACR
jgi:hypothetical protein